MALLGSFYGQFMLEPVFEPGQVSRDQLHQPATFIGTRMLYQLSYRDLVTYYLMINI